MSKREQILAATEFLAGVIKGIEQLDRGEFVTLQELKLKYGLKTGETSEASGKETGNNEEKSGQFNS